MSIRYLSRLTQVSNNVEYSLHKKHCTPSSYTARGERLSRPYLYVDIVNVFDFMSWFLPLVIIVAPLHHVFTQISEISHRNRENAIQPQRV